MVKGCGVLMEAIRHILSPMVIGGVAFISLAVIAAIQIDRDIPNIDLRKLIMGRQALSLGVMMVVGAFALSFLV